MVNLLNMSRKNLATYILAAGLLTSVIIVVNYFFKMIKLSKRKEVYCYIIVTFFNSLSNCVCVISQTSKLTIAKDHSDIPLKLDTDEFKRKNPQAKIFI
jgi:hypothetical protein